MIPAPCRSWGLPDDVVHQPRQGGDGTATRGQRTATDEREHRRPDESAESRVLLVGLCHERPFTGIGRFTGTGTIRPVLPASGPVHPPERKST